MSNLIDEPIHLHRETEIALVLRGTIKCKIHNMGYDLEAGDLVLVDWDDLHYFYEGSEDFLCTRMYIRLNHFKDKYPNIDYIIFICEKNDLLQNDEKNDPFRNKRKILKQSIAQITLATINENSKKQIEGIATEFVDVLFREFRVFL